MQIVIFGLGRMGMQIAKRLQKNKHQVLAWNRSEAARKEFEVFGGKAFSDVKSVIQAVPKGQRVFWLMLPHAIVEDFLFSQLAPFLQPGDIVIDGGNSFYKDSMRRAAQLESQGVYFFDCGVSGGVWGFKNGFALMVGGPKEQWPAIEPVIKALSSGQNYGLVGTSGAGHFVKMVHNGIEYGMMEAIAEGYGILQASQFKPDLKVVTRIYQEGSVIKSWLIDLMFNIFETEKVEKTSGFIEATGEGEWSVNAAKELGVDARVIEDALAVRRESQDKKNQSKYSNKLVALLRKQFGGHGVVNNKT